MPIAGPSSTFYIGLLEVPVVCLKIHISAHAEIKIAAAEINRVRAGSPPNSMHKTLRRMMPHKLHLTSPSCLVLFTFKLGVAWRRTGLLNRLAALTSSADFFGINP